MKFSIFSLATFLTLASAHEDLAKRAVVTVYNPPKVVTSVANVYVTVTAGAPIEDPALGVETVVIEKTAYVDQFGNIIEGPDSGKESTRTVTGPYTPKPSTPTFSIATPSTASVESSSTSTPAVVSSSSTTTTTSTTTSTSSSTPSSTSSTPSSTTVIQSTTLAVSTSSTTSTSTTTSTSSTTSSTTTPPPSSTPVPSSTTTTSTQAPVDTGANLDEFAKQIVDSHNRLRALHGSPPLTWDTDLVAFAENFLANQNCEFAHSGGPYGENLAIGYRTPERAVQAWYDEIQYYNWNNPGFAMNTGHFTQVVWKSTSRIGCAMVACPNRGDFLACEYDSPGNVQGWFDREVPPLL